MYLTGQEKKQCVVLGERLNRSEARQNVSALRDSNPLGRGSLVFLENASISP